MEITVSQAQGRVPVTVLHITGAITSSEELEQRAKEAFDAGAKDLLVDLTNVPYIATAGLRALHTIYTQLRTDSPAESDAAVSVGIRDGTFSSPHLKLLKPSPHAMEALHVAGYDMFLEIYQDLQHAVASF
jgi:STAS domain-containing protein